MNPHSDHLTSPVAMMRSVWEYRNLIKQMIWRDVVGRYKGSLFGLAWSFVTPLLMLVVYTFVFAVVFTARWGGDVDQSKAHFASVLFIGLILHGMFAEVLNRAPSLIIENQNFVKKVVFPLEVLTVVSIGSAIFHLIVNLFVLLIVSVFLNGFPHWTIVLVPFTMLPFIFMTLGFAWFLTSLGVYVRDIKQVIGVATTALLFFAPVFYPLSALPEEYRWAMYLNPITLPIEQSRAVFLLGASPQWLELAIYLGVSLVICYLGFAWFQKTRKGFSDVL